MISAPRALELFHQWIAGEVAVARDVTDAELVLPLFTIPHATNLGQAILLNTGSATLICHLLRDRHVDVQPVLRIFLVLLVYFWIRIDHLREICDVLGGPCAIRMALGHDPAVRFDVTPLGYAIQYFAQDVTRLFLQWGASLPSPPNEALPSWVWSMSEEIRIQRERCRKAVIVFSHASRIAMPKQTGWHNICPTVMKMIWETRFITYWG